MNGMKSIILAVCVVAITLVFTISAFSDITLSSVIGENMVLQRDMKINVWGWADPGETVTVSIGGNEAKAITGENGKWSVVLPAMKAGGPHEMTVTGKNTITIGNILVGEVWLCSGQSNMEFGLGGAENAKEAADAADYPEIRFLTIPRVAPGRPIDRFNAKWVVCTPQSAPGFSAVGYFFGREIHSKAGVPVGLINASWGGTPIEPWTPREGFAAVPELEAISALVTQAGPNYEKTVGKALEQIDRWLPVAKKEFTDNKEVTPPPAWPHHPLEGMAPTGIYNGMISPIVPFTIRGAIWYQGEANVGQGMEYHHKMQALIRGWRKVWGEGDFPFYYVQIAPYTYNRGEELPKIWEAQTATLDEPNTGMAVINDVGNARDIHPRKKEEVGERLALWALAKTYGQKDIVYSGPLFKSMSIDGSNAIITFDHVGSGLTSRDEKPLNWFTIAGEDKKFVDAKAVIDGEKIVVSSPDVPKPVAVRFAWNEIAEPNLTNKEGLPASPFRTDSW